MREAARPRGMRLASAAKIAYKLRQASQRARDRVAEKKAGDHLRYNVRNFTLRKLLMCIELNQEPLLTQEEHATSLIVVGQIFCGAFARKGNQACADRLICMIV